MAIPFYKTSTFTGLISTKDYGTSEDWYNAFFAVSAGLTGVGLPQTLLWNSSAYELSISEGNTISLGSLSSVTVETMVGATSSTDGQEGLVPKPLSGDNTKYLRGDGTWQNIEVPVSNIQYIVGEPVIDLDVRQYDTFVVTVEEPIVFTYSNFTVGKTIVVYLNPNHLDHIGHTFPEGTLFTEIGDGNIVYSFEGYYTKVMLQNIGDYIINFSTIVSKEEIVPPYVQNSGGINSELL